METALGGGQRGLDEGGDGRDPAAGTEENQRGLPIRKTKMSGGFHDVERVPRFDIFVEPIRYPAIVDALDGDLVLGLGFRTTGQRITTHQVMVAQGHAEGQELPRAIREGRFEFLGNRQDKRSGIVGFIDDPLHLQIEIGTSLVRHGVTPPEMGCSSTSICGLRISTGRSCTETLAGRKSGPSSPTRLSTITCSER